jgi:hypothetical protein
MRVSGDWQSAFNLHTAKHFPTERQGNKIDCGAASFWLLVRDLMVLRQSPSIFDRAANPSYVVHQGTASHDYYFIHSFTHSWSGDDG